MPDAQPTAPPAGTVGLHAKNEDLDAYAMFAVRSDGSSRPLGTWLSLRSATRLAAETGLPLSFG